jgi:small subunit ribosomal protein S6e
MKEVELQETIGVLRMPLKLNISNKEKAWKIEIPNDILIGKSIGDKISGKTIKPEFEGYELEITGGSDFSGFPMDGDTEGIGLKKVLLKKGWGMWTKPKGLKKKKPRARPGLRLRKTVRGKTISEKTVQVNLKIIKEGHKKLTEIFPEQNQPKQKVEKTSVEAKVNESEEE